MVKFKRFWLPLGLVLLLLSAARPAQVQGPQEGWQVYTNANHVQDLALEGGGALRGGYTWVATDGGVVCYGPSERVKSTILDGLPSNDIYALAEDSGGRWWFGTYYGGISVLDDGGTPFDREDDAWTTFTTADGLAHNWVEAITEDGRGRLWFGTHSGVSVLDNGGTPSYKGDDTWTTFTMVDGLAHYSVETIAEDSGGRMWFGTWGGGVSVLEYGGTPFDKSDDTWTTFTTTDGMEDGHVYAIAEDSGERLWFGTGGGASVLDDGGTLFDKGDDAWITFTTTIDPLMHNLIWAITEDDSGRLWFGTPGGVSVLDDGGTPFGKGDDTWISFTMADGLAYSGVVAIAADGGGRMWFGTYYSGVSVLDDGGTPFDKRDDNWSTFSTADLPTYNGIEAIAEDGGGLLWFGTYGGVGALDDRGTPFDKGDDTWTIFSTSDGLEDSAVLAIAADDERRMWFGTHGGVSVLDDGGTPFDKRDDTWTTFTTSDGLADDTAWVIARESGGRWWFGTRGGASVLDDGGTPFEKGDDTWISFTTADGLADDSVYAVALADGKRSWFGTDGGVSVLDNGGTPFSKGDDTWVIFTTADGLAANVVNAIAGDSGGRMWFGTWDSGVSVLEYGGTLFDKRDDTWTTFTTTDGLVSNKVQTIAVDSAGRWWFGTYRGGISVLDNGGTPFDKGDDTWTSFTTTDGLADNSVEAIFVDRVERLWFGTYSGVGELVDAVAPASSASSPAYVIDGAIPVSCSATDGASHVFSTSLWVKCGNGGTWTDTGLSQRGQSAGAFNYTPTQGHGTYYFATVAEDWMGNVEAPPTGSGDTSTVYGTTEPGDVYEPDDSCAHASTIPTDGTVQVHTFHDDADSDWVTFDAISGTTYLIEALVPADSSADVALELYDRCDGPLQDGQDHAFSPGVRLEFQPPADGPLYLKLLNHDPAVYGPDVGYHLSVRALADTPTPGAVVIVAGKRRDGDPLQPNIHHVTDAVYRLFRAHGYDGDRIHYLATDVTLDPDDDGTPDVDGLPTRANLQQAIAGWAAGKVGPDRAFTLYLMDHGGYDRFYLNGPTQTVDPDDIDGWLDILEGAAPGVRVNVIVEACHSGSFIDSASASELIQTVSGSSRVVIASTGAHALAYATDDGAVFSDPFLQALGSGTSLYGSFQEARWAAQEAHPDQTPWLDDDGDGMPNEGEDGQEASQRGFAYAGTLGESWPPYVASAGVGEIQAPTGVITAEVRDDGDVSRVWAMIYPPSYRPPTSGEELVQETGPTVTLSYVGNGIYSSEYDGFTEAGPYRVVVYAVDEEGLAGRPKAVGAQHRIYLPLIVNNYASRVTLPVHVGDAIPARAVGHQGEVFHTTSVRMPEEVPPGGRFYFSSQRDAVAEVLVDDELGVLLDGGEVFTYRFSSEDGSPELVVVEMPRAVMEGLVGRTVTVEYRDVYADVVEASVVWLIWTP